MPLKRKNDNWWHRNIYTLVCICDENKNLWLLCNSLIAKENHRRTAVRKTKFSFALIGETRKSKGIFKVFPLYIKLLQLCKLPCPRKSPNGEFGWFLRISALRNADFSNAPFCKNRDKSLQFNLKHRHKKSRMACHHTASRQKNGGGLFQSEKSPCTISRPVIFYPARRPERRTEGNSAENACRLLASALFAHPECQAEFFQVFA